MQHISLPNGYKFKEVSVDTAPMATILSNAPGDLQFQDVGGVLFPKSVEKSLLLRTHPSISSSNDVFHRASYKGGKAYIESGYLFTHSKEAATDWQNRSQRAYFYNYCKPIIDSYLYFLFKSNPSRLGEVATESDIMKFLADPSRGVDEINDMMKQHAFTLLLLGRAWFCMDAPSTAPISQLDEVEDRTNLPYLFHYPAELVLDWAEGPEGTLLWVKAISKEDAKKKFDYASATNDVIKIWTPQAIVRYDLDGNILSGDANPMQVVPFVLTKLNDELMSFIGDMAIINRSIFNWCSLLDEVLYKQTFSQLVIPGDPKQALAEKRVGIAQAFTFPPDARIAPHFISPDAEQGQLIQSQIDNAIMEIYRAANLEWVDSKRATNKSGSAKNFDFQNTNKVLGGIAGQLEHTEKTIFTLFNKIRGNGARETPKTQYPRDFSVAALESELTNIFFALTRRISPHLNKMLKKRATELLMPRLEQADKVKIEQEIDSAPDDSELTAEDINTRTKEMVDSAMSANVRGTKGSQVKAVVP